MKIISNEIIETSRLYSDNPTDYPFCRIPALVATENGLIYMCYECRQASDWSVIDIALRRSDNGGKTWSGRRIIADGKGRNACNNPTLLADGNKLILIYCENYKRVFMTVSNDCGNTWSVRTELTDTFDAYYWSCVAIGPGHGVVTQDGDYIIPFWIALNQQDMFSHHPSKAGILISKNRGLSWEISTVFDDSLCNPSEISVAVLSNGNLLANIRNENDEKCRAFSVMNRKTGVWSDCSLRYDLPDPTCFSGLCSGGKKLFLVNCHHESERKNLSVCVSLDDGRNWIPDLLDASGGYADICYNQKTDTVFVLYETKQCRYLKIAELKF